MVLQGPTFASIKLSLLYLYRRLFIVNESNQYWFLKVWQLNLLYVYSWALGSMGFYLLQCKPVDWYWIRYYEKQDPTFTKTGQCNATTVNNVAIPLILGLFSDVALILLPGYAIWKLQVSTRKKTALGGVFSVGVM